MKALKEDFKTGHSQFCSLAPASLGFLFCFGAFFSCGRFFGKRQKQTAYVLGMAICNHGNLRQCRKWTGRRKKIPALKQLKAQHFKLTNEPRLHGQNVQESSEFLIKLVPSVFYYAFPLFKINNKASAFLKSNCRFQYELTFPYTNKIACRTVAREHVNSVLYNPQKEEKKKR